MIREQDLVGMIETLQAETLQRWCALGWVAPRAHAEGHGYEDADVARVRLICDLVYDLEIGEEGVPVILSLIDQLHGTRRMLRAMAAAIDEQPDDVRLLIAERARTAMGHS